MKCIECGNETINAKFCSRHCANTYNNKRFPKRRRTWNVKCKECGADVHRRENTFCSVVCRQKYRTNLAKHGKGGAHLAKQLVWATRPHKCEICGLEEEWNGKKLVLQFDHVDGDSDNQNPSNIRIICPNCHTQTKTWCKKSRVPKNDARNQRLRKYYKNAVIVESVS